MLSISGGQGARPHAATLLARADEVIECSGASSSPSSAAAAAWPLAVRAQQPERMRRIGVLVGLAEDDPETKARLTGFRQGLEKRGWSEGHNVRIDYRFAPAGAQAQVLAKELVALQPDAIFANGTPIVAALQRESSTIPIVFAGVADPIGSGFIASLPRPGGNITGVMLYEASVTGKWLAMLKEIAPSLVRAAFVANPETATFYGYYLREGKALGPSLGIDVVLSPVKNDAADIERAIEFFARAPNGGLVVPPDITTVVHRDLIIALATRHRMPAIYSFRPSSRPAGLCRTGWTSSTCFGRRHPMSTASCAATSPPTCRYRRRPSSKRPSTSRLPRRSA